MIGLSVRKIEGQTELAALGLPFLDVVLEEIFFIPPGTHLPEKPRPVTIYDLARISARPLDQVTARLEEIQALSAGIVLEDGAAATALFAELRPGQPLLFDVRFAAEATREPIPGARHLPTMTTAEVGEVLIADESA